MTPIYLARSRMSLSFILAGGITGFGGFLAAPALAQAGQAIAGGGPMTWESLGLGGLAVALSIWGMRESDKKRIEEAQRMAQSLADLNERRLDEERDHRANIERVHATKMQVYEKMVSTMEHELAQKDTLLQDLLAKALSGAANSGRSAGGVP